MKFAEIHARQLIDGYNSGKSMTQLAKELNTNAMKISRALKSLGIKSRDQSEAMKLALKEGRAIHPTEGKQHSEEVKLKISESRAKHWDSLTDEERERIIVEKREQWNSMSDEKRAEIKKKAHKALLVSAKEGSKVENLLYRTLIDSGYKCLMHTRPIENDKLEVDLHIVDLKVVVEIDGPTHQSPEIWGQEAFDKTKRADTEKNGLLLQKGFTVVRLKTLSKTLSKKYQRDITKALLDTLDDIKNGKTGIIEVKTWN